MRYRLRTLLTVLMLGPPVLAIVWRLFSREMPLWLVIALFVSLLELIPYVLFATFGALCHLIAWLPGGNDRKDTKF